jgi:hypothetical protein
MNRILYSGLMIAALVFAGDGRPPRASSSDYPVHEDTKTATIAALRVPAEQLNKNFPSELSKKYPVVEVAIYPKDGATVDIATMDFVLRLADGESRPETPEEVASIWRPRGNGGPDLPGRTRVTTETGVIVATGTDPNTGRKATNVGTYEKVGVASGDDPNRPVQYPRGTSSVDADRMEAQLGKWALPEGKTTGPVAGYLYFPLPVKKSKGPLELQYTHDGAWANLTLK